MSIEPDDDSLTTTPSDRLRVSEATGMRALAHPARLVAIQHLMTVGPATATELGDVAELSPSAMSYHLRTLERAGLIETAPSRGDGRERVWRSTHGVYEVESLDKSDEDARTASVELLETMLAVQEVETRQWLSKAQVPGWLDNGFFTEAILVATQAELEELGRAIIALLKPYTPRERRDTAPDAAVPTRVIFRGFPTSPPSGPSADVAD
jgi:DNA-binding transcriptional ArsR family regulator